MKMSQWKQQLSIRYPKEMKFVKSKESENQNEKEGNFDIEITIYIINA